MFRCFVLLLGARPFGIDSSTVYASLLVLSLGTDEDDNWWWWANNVNALAGNLTSPEIYNSKSRLHAGSHRTCNTGFESFRKNRIFNFFISFSFSFTQRLVVDILSRRGSECTKRGYGILIKDSQMGRDVWWSGFRRIVLVRIDIDASSKRLLALWKARISMEG